MASSEQIAWRMYRDLPAADRRVVDAWRELGNDWVTSLLNARVLTSGRRQVPADDPTEHFRRRYFPDEELKRREVAEHEAAHAVVALALGVPVSEVTTVPDGEVGGSVTFRTSSRRATAIILAAAEVWITEFRWRTFPTVRESGFGDDRRKVLEATGADAWQIQDAARRAREILADRRDEVLEMAQRLMEHERLTFGG